MGQTRRIGQEWIDAPPCLEIVDSRFERPVCWIPPSLFRAACARGKPHPAIRYKSANGRADARESASLCPSSRERSVERGARSWPAVDGREAPSSHTATEPRLCFESKPRLNGRPKGTQSCAEGSPFPCWPSWRCWRLE